MYELFVKLFHISYASIIGFLPNQLEYKDNTLAIHSVLTAPITEDVVQLVKNGYKFKVKNELTLIINAKHVRNRTMINTLSFGNGYKVNGIAIPNNKLQYAMGVSNVIFTQFRFDEGDIILIVLKARIAKDDTFTRSTGLSTGVIWNYYIPRIRQQWKYTKGEFVIYEG